MYMSLQEIQTHVNTIENNEVHQQARYIGITSYRTTLGFFNFNEDEKIKIIEECFCSDFISGFIESNENSCIMLDNNLRNFFAMNIIICDTKYFNSFYTYKNSIFISDNQHLVEFVHFGLTSIKNKDDNDQRLTMIIDPCLFLILNNVLTTRNYYVSRAIFVNTDDMITLRTDLKIMAGFTWVENRYNNFKNGGYISRVFLETCRIKGLYQCITVDYYNPFYDEESSIKFNLNIDRVKPFMVKNYISQRLQKVSKERKENVCNIVSRKEETECSICLETICKNTLLGLTSCCQYPICGKCSDNIVKERLLYKCFACREQRFCFHFIKPYNSYLFSLKEIITDFNNDIRYLIVTSKHYQKYLYKEKNIVVTRYPFRLKNFNFQAVIFMAYYSEIFKEKLMATINDRTIKIYEIL